MTRAVSQGQVLPPNLAIQANQLATPERAFIYPRRISLLWRGSLFIGFLLSLLHWAWVVSRAASTAAATVAQILSPQLPSLAIPWPNIQLPPASALEFLGAHVALLFALFFVLLAYNLFPEVMLRGEGIGVGTLDGWITVPWNGIRRLVSTDTLFAGRLVVFVEVERGVLGQLWRVYGLLFGLGPRPGFLLTTDLSGFDNIVSTLASRLLQARAKENISGEEVEEQHRSWFLTLTFDLPNHLERILGNRGWQKAPTREAGLIWGTVVASWLVLVIIRAAASGALNPLILMGLVFLAAFEVVVATTGLWALGDVYSGYSDWTEISLLYPASQFPRLLLLPWLVLSQTAALPFLLMGIVGILAAVVVAYLATNFTRLYYSLPSLRSALPGAFLPALYYLLLWAILILS